MGRIDDLERHYDAICSVIRSHTKQVERLNAELEELHKEAERLEREIVAESNQPATQNPGVSGCGV